MLDKIQFTIFKDEGMTETRQVGFWPFRKKTETVQLTRDQYFVHLTIGGEKGAKFFYSQCYFERADAERLVLILTEFLTESAANQKEKS